MLKKLHEFLKGEEMKAVEKREYEHATYYTYFVKVKSGIDGIDLVYKAESNTEGVIGAFKGMEFAGIYSKPKDTFYYVYLYFIPYNDVDEILGTRLISVDSLWDELHKKTTDEIISRIGYDENSIKGVEVSIEELKRIKKHYVPKESKELFMNGKCVDKHEYIDIFSLPEVKYSDTLLLLYLDNPKKIIERESEKYIKEKASYIYKNIIKNKLIEKELEEMNKDEKLIENRKIFSILSSLDMKTVNVEFLREGEVFKCKLETNSWNYIDSRISSYDVVGRADTDKFEEMFRDARDDASFDNVTKITYSRKVLYERKEQEDVNELV